MCTVGSDKNLESDVLALLYRQESIELMISYNISEVNIVNGLS